MGGAARSAGTRLAVLGLAVVLVGVVSYFAIVVHFGAWLPEVRNTAYPNLALVVVGLVLSVIGARRAFAAPRGTRGRRLTPALASLSVLLAAAFAWMLYVASAVPPIGGPVVGKPAPDFVAVDQSGHTIRLADFHGTPLLLVFYRGHW
jgi:hypothetical protein